MASYTDQSALDATSLRVDHLVGTRLTLFGRYNYAPSSTTARLYALNNPTDTLAHTTTLTLGATALPSPHLSNDLRANYSHSTGARYCRLDAFGGAQPIDPAQFFPSFADPRDSFVGFFLTGGVNSGWYLGKNVANDQHQHNVVDTVSWVAGAHQLKVGVDYRRIGTYNGPRTYDQFAYFIGGFSTISGRASQVLVEAQDPGSLHFTNLSLFAQDTWKVRPRLTLTYGLR